MILGKLWSIFDLQQRRNRKFLGDDQGCLSEQTVLGEDVSEYQIPPYFGNHSSCSRLENGGIGTGSEVIGLGVISLTSTRLVGCPNLKVHPNNILFPFIKRFYS